jgi:nitrate reductase gamma subunit
MATVLTLGALLLVLTSGLLAYVASMHPADYHLVMETESWAEPTVIATDTARDAEAARISAAQFRIGALAAAAALAAALTQLAAIAL